MDNIFAFHFVGDTLRDGRPIPSDGEWLTHDGPVVMCISGLHASLEPSNVSMLHNYCESLPARKL